jgi:tetratricopeptide (TPR) repeat protein
VAAVASAALGRAAGVMVAVGLAGGALVAQVVLPRAAHRAFRRGAYGRAALLYGLLRRVRLGRDVRAALDVSAAACLLGRERYRDGLAVLDRIDQASMGESARAAWLNNRAYALVRSGTDAPRALADIERAIELRPDLSGFRHTRGLALLALGRVDEAIRDLDAVWRRQEPGEAQPLLEAERCYDLGLAWVRKGERDYAADYFERARRAAPESVWASRAVAELGASAIPSSIADLI